jgi:hypothetical protein
MHECQSALYTSLILEYISPPPPSRTLSFSLTRFLTHLLTQPSSLPPSLPIAQADSEEAKKELTKRQKRRQQDKARKAKAAFSQVVQLGGGGGDGDDIASVSMDRAAAVPGSPLNGWLQDLDEVEETLSKALERQRKY